VSQKVVNPTSTSSHVNGQTTLHQHQQKTLNNKNDKTTVSKNFNLNSLTSLAHANLNDQLFKDLKITSNMQKKLNLSASSAAPISNHNSNNLTKKNDNRNGLKLNEDFDEKSMRPKLGDEMVNAVEDYFSKFYKKNYVWGIFGVI